MVLAALWTGWTLYSRQQSADEQERRSKEKQADVDRKLVDEFGGDQLTILGFNAAKKEIATGGRVLMCYGVSNATAVRIEPGVEPINPALSALPGSIAEDDHDVHTCSVGRKRKH